jgi:hypothetical protein
MSVRETEDDYRYVVGSLGPKWRLIECATDIQWIVQELKGKQWRNYWHCRTKAGLMVKYRHAVIDALPDRYRPRSERAQIRLTARQVGE